jgi:hypothetical protein
MGVANRVEEIAKRVPFLRRPFYQRDVAILERDALAARLAALGDIVRHSAVAPASIPDTRADLRSLSDWKRLLAQNPSIQASAHIARMVSHGMRHGVTSPFLGKIAPSEMELSGTNYREHFVARGFNPRQRAILDLTHEVVGHRSIHDVSIYAHEALTPLALVMRGRYPRFLGSEYAPNPVDRERIFPIPHIDIMKSGRVWLTARSNTWQRRNTTATRWMSPPGRWCFRFPAGQFWGTLSGRAFRMLICFSGHRPNVVMPATPICPVSCC